MCDVHLPVTYLFYVCINVPLLPLKQNTYVKYLLLFVQVNNVVLTIKTLQILNLLFKARSKDHTFV